jgi:hypothetical protein
LIYLDAGQDHVIFNADGIYLATYVTLLLNFELAKREYYPSRTGFVAQSEVFRTVYNFASLPTESVNTINFKTCRMISLPVFLTAGYWFI